MLLLKKLIVQVVSRFDAPQLFHTVSLLERPVDKPAEISATIKLAAAATIDAIRHQHVRHLGMRLVKRSLEILGKRSRLRTRLMTQPLPENIDQLLHVGVVVHVDRRSLRHVRTRNAMLLPIVPLC